MGLLKKAWKGYKKAYNVSRGVLPGEEKKKKNFKRQSKKTKGLLSDIENQQNALYGKQTSAMANAIRSINERGAQSLGELDKTYGAEKRDVKERGQQTFAQGSQDLTRRGLGNTTITGGLHRGVGEDVNRQMGRLTASEAGQRADVFSQLGNQEQGAYSMLANIYGQQAQGNTNLGLGSIAGRTQQYQSSQYTDLFGLVGTGIGAFYGGPAGASAGAAIGQSAGGLFDG